MQSDPVGRVTRLLEEAQAGSDSALGELIPLVYDELRRIAGRLMREERSGHTLQATSLVHEAYLRLVGQQRVRWAGRTHFMAIAATVMRRVLLDHARRHRAGKRGGGNRVTLVDELAPGAAPEIDVLALDEALTRLEAAEARAAKVVELRYFGGLGIEETAEALGVSPMTVKRDWRFARAWLFRQLSEEAESPSLPPIPPV
jgi:RNA polymerase sigma factor (TIGR02999 family)